MQELTMILILCPEFPGEDSTIFARLFKSAVKPFVSNVKVLQLLLAGKPPKKSRKKSVQNNPNF